MAHFQTLPKALSNSAKPLFQATSTPLFSHLPQRSHPGSIFLPQNLLVPSCCTASEQH